MKSSPAISFERLREILERAERLAYENHRSIWIVRGPKFGTLEQVWPKFKAWI